MQLSHRQSATKKTKYFGVNIGGDFVKLQSKKASLFLIQSVANNNPLFLTKNTVSDSHQVISKITRIDSNKLYNYLNQNYEIQHSNRSNNNSSSTTQSHNHNQRSQDVELLQTTRIEPSGVHHLEQSDCVPHTLQAAELFDGGQQIRGHKRVLPTKASSFYGPDTIEAILDCVRNFTNGEPGSVEAMYQLRVDIDDARAANFLDDEAVGKLEENIRLGFECAEQELNFAEGKRRFAEGKRRFAELLRADAEFELGAKKKKQKLSKSAKVRKNKRNKAALV